MKRCLYTFIIGIGCVLLIGTGVAGAQSVPRNFLQDVVAEKEPGSLIIKLQFKRPVSRFEAPVFLNNSVQMDLPDARIRLPKRFFYTGDNRIPQIAATQISSKTLRVQFVLGEKLPGLKENFKLEKRGKTLTVRIAQGEAEDLDVLLAQAAKRWDTPPTARKEQPAPPVSKPRVVRVSKPADPVPQVQKVRAVKPEKQNLSLEQAAESRTVESEGLLDPLPAAVRMFTMLSVVLGIMFLLFYVFKKFVLKNTLFGGNEKLVRVLGTGFLGPKKNIALVEIADEVLVLGISNDNISLLSNIRDEERIEKIRAFGEKKNKNPAHETRRKVKKTEKPARTLPDASPESRFSRYLEEYSDSRSPKERSVDEVTEKIRKNLTKLRSL